MSEIENIDPELAATQARILKLAGRLTPSENPQPRKDFDAKLKEAGFPSRHRGKVASESLFGPSAAKAKELLPKILSGDALIILIGDRGPGKTQMVTWWASQRLDSGKSAGLYVKCADMIGEIKSTWHDGGKSLGSEQDVLRKYKRTPYLAIDEFHEKGASEWEARCIVNIIDHRYDNMLTTAIIANLSPSKITEAINPSILSRAEETGGLVVCDWPSYRATATGASQ